MLLLSVSSTKMSGCSSISMTSYFSGSNIRTCILHVFSNVNLTFLGILLFASNCSSKRCSIPGLPTHLPSDISCTISSSIIFHHNFTTIFTILNFHVISLIVWHCYGFMEKPHTSNIQYPACFLQGNTKFWIFDTYSSCLAPGDWYRYQKSGTGTRA